MSDSIVVHDSEGREVESQLVPIANASLYIRDKHVKAYLGTLPAAKPKFWIAFPVSVPPLGFNTYFVSSGKRSGEFMSFVLICTKLEIISQFFLQIFIFSIVLPAIVSTTSTLNSHGSENSNLQVGQGRLKLQYDSAGELSLYSDSKTRVICQCVA